MEIPEIVGLLRETGFHIATRKHIVMVFLDWIVRWSVLDISPFIITFYVLSLCRNHIENHRTILKPPLFPLQGLLQGIVYHDVRRDMRWHVDCLDEVLLSLYWDACLLHVLADTRPGTGLFIN